MGERLPSVREEARMKLYDSAFQQATEDERALALVYLKRWLETRRD